MVSIDNITYSGRLPKPAVPASAVPGASRPESYARNDNDVQTKKEGREVIGF